VVKAYFFQIKTSADRLQMTLSQVIEKHFTISSNISRAIMAYLPPKNSHFEKEFKALLLSIAFMRVSQPKNIKTDFIIFTPESNINTPLSVGCVQNLR
jgi:hypothetical protein